MADAYIQHMKDVQKQGPYLLGGYSLGFHIAFEMARQLIGQDEEVLLLVNLDAGAPSSSNPECALTTSLLEFAKENGLPGLQAEELNQLDKTIRMHYVLKSLKGNIPPRDYEILNHVAPIWYAHELAIDAYFRKSLEKLRVKKYPGTIAVFSAKSLNQTAEGTPVEDPLGKSRTRGWDQLSSGRIDVYQIEGNHQTFLREPHVRDLCLRLETAIATSSSRDRNGALEDVRSSRGSEFAFDRKEVDLGKR